MTLLGLTGKKRSGKDTVGGILATFAGFERRSFAASIKDIAKEVFWLLPEQLDGDLKEVVDPRYGWTPRFIMQKIGTESGRNGDFSWAGAHEAALRQAFARWGLTPGPKSLWIDFVFDALKGARYMATARGFSVEDLPSIVITDVRFQNEAEAVRANGGVVWRVVRPAPASSVDSHPSEVEMDSIVADTTLVNDGTLLDLVGKVQVEYDKLRGA